MQTNLNSKAETPGFKYYCCCCCGQVASVVSDSVRPHRRQPTRLPHPWDSPGKNTGVGCHFLLQCMKVKVKVKALSSVRLLVIPWTAAHQAPLSMAFSRHLSTGSSNSPCITHTGKCKLLSCVRLCDPVDYTVHGILQARILEWVAFPFSRGSFQPGDQTQVSQIAGGFLPAESPGKPKNTEWVAFPFSRRSSQPRDRTRVPYITGGFFTN